MKKFDVKEYSLIPPPYGGVSVFLLRLISRLNQDGVRAGAYYSLDNKDPEYVNSPLFDVFTWDGRDSKLCRFMSHVKRMFKASQHYQIIHIHGHEVMILAALIHLIMRQKIVVTIHNSMITETYSRFSVVKRMAFNYLAKQDITWIAVSEQAKERMQKLPVRFRNPIFVIPAYIPDRSQLQPLFKQLDDYIKNHKYIISFYGRSFMSYCDHDVYGFRAAIKVYSRIKESIKESVGFVLCISDVSNLEGINAIHNYAKELQVDDAIYWQLGPIKGIRALWMKTNLYIRPTYTDGDSVSIRDVIAEGASVVASDVCPRPEGVITYHYDDEEDLFQKCLGALNSNRGAPKDNDTYYQRIKNIYFSLLMK